MRKRKGFTLIEIMVVVGIFGMLMSVVIGVLLNSFKAKNRVELANLVEENGRFIQAEIRRNLLAAKGTTVLCPVGVGRSIGFENNLDGASTVISCVSGEIASDSANPVTLSADNMTATCTSFVRCSGDSPTVDIEFDLSTGTAGSGGQNYVTRKFKQSMVVRN